MEATSIFPTRRCIVIIILLIQSVTNANAHPHIDKDQNEEAIRIYRTDAPIHDIAEDHRGMLYFASAAGVLEFDGVAIRTIPLPNTSVATRLLTTPDGRVYTGGEGELGFLAPDNNGTMTYVSLMDRIPDTGFSDPIINIHSLGQKIIFVAEKNIYILQDNLFDVLQTDDYFYSSIVHNNSLFVIDGKHGLLRLHDDRLQPIPGWNFFRAYKMMPYKDNKILIMTHGKGPIIFDLNAQVATNSGPNHQNPFNELTEPNANLFKQHIITSGLLIDDDKYLLGLMRYGMVLIDTSGRILSTFNQSNALISNDVYVIYKDSQNHIWAGLDQGIMPLREMYNQITMAQEARPKSQAVNEDAQIPFTAVIRKVETVMDDELVFGGAFFKLRGGVQKFDESELTFQRLPYEKNTLRFNFSSNHLARSDQIQYQTFLKGLDKGWTPWSKRIYREFSGLPWREYTFSVRAQNSDGVISKATTFTFQILPPWYETLWFYSGQVAFFMLLLLLIGIFRGTKRKEIISEQIIVVMTFIALTYLRDTIGISDMISKVDGGIPFFKILFAAAFALLLEPIKKFLKKSMRKIDINLSKQSSNTVQ